MPDCLIVDFWDFGEESIKADNLEGTGIGSDDVIGFDYRSEHESMVPVSAPEV